MKQKKKHQWNTYIPKFEYTTDNAAMIGITGYYKYILGDFETSAVSAKARMTVLE